MSERGVWIYECNVCRQRTTSSTINAGQENDGGEHCGRLREKVRWLPNGGDARPQRPEGGEVKNPTELEIAAEYKRVFPLCHLSEHERAFLATIYIARSHGVGFGWMRQAVGLAWKVADPIGYIDDDRVIAFSGGLVCPKCGASWQPQNPTTCGPCGGYVEDGPVTAEVYAAELQKAD